MATKSYKIKVITKKGGYTISRENSGFNVMELLGILEHTKQDIISRMAKGIKPDIIETKVILDEEE